MRTQTVNKCHNLYAFEANSVLLILHHRESGEAFPLPTLDRHRIAYSLQFHRYWSSCGGMKAEDLKGVRNDTRRLVKVLASAEERSSVDALL